MAANNKGTRADKAVSEAKKKASNGKNTTKSAKNTGKKPAPSENKKASAINTELAYQFPVNAVIAIITGFLFVFFLVTAVNPDGALLQIVQSFMMGMLGKVGFYFTIPAMLYLFIIHTFGRKHKLKMRSICTLTFVVICGCVSHLTLDQVSLSSNLSAVGDLYQGGVAGTTGGLICGGLGAFFRWACGDTISYILLLAAAVLTLLGALQITVYSLFRAIENRPRDEYDEMDEEEEEEVDPASLLVNHIATKRIEYTRQRRQRIAEAPEPVMMEETVYRAGEPVPQEAQQTYANASNKAKSQKSAPAKKPAASTGNPRADAVMNQIDSDIESPVSAAAEHVFDEEAVIETRSNAKKKPSSAEVPADEPDVIPQTMPELLMDEPIAQAPRFAPEPKQEPRKSAPRPISESAPAEELPVAKEKVTAKDAAASAQLVAAEIAQNAAVQKPVYCFPPISLLKRPARGIADGTAEMRENSRRLNETLASFKIDAHITNVTRGPSVTRYEVELDKGVRLSKLTGCADDIALSLGASGVRIAAVPGKISIVGIEVPNRAVTMVSLREVIDSPEFNQSASKSSFAVGKDIGGSCIVGNIAKMPHMLIAGTTGSGKSVCMNSLIISLLYKASPEDVKLIMVDPKMVELANYNGIPHLMIPVVTDPKKAAGALQWAVTEMMRRYKTMSDAGVRDLESFNSIVMAEGGEKTPQLIVIIDELADLMLVAAKEVEDSICRIAQMGRAAGIHLVIATQRPSADVITGLMKANIPSRIAFSVASAMESRIILDTVGAEKLVGKGDMLFAPIGSGKPLRVQGCFVTDPEVEAVTTYVKDNFVADYNQQVLEEIERKAQQTGTGKKALSAADPEPNSDELDGDEMLPAAVDVILETGQASVSMLQRRLKLGYARAARIVDEMEEKGIVGPFQGSKPRAILITKEQWQAQRGGGCEQMALDDYAEDFSDIPEDYM